MENLVETVAWITPNYRETWRGLPIEKNAVSTELVCNDYLDKKMPDSGEIIDE
jgi:hypothetical protein